MCTHTASIMSFVFKWIQMNLKKVQKLFYVLKESQCTFILIQGSIKDDKAGIYAKIIKCLSPNKSRRNYVTDGIAFNRRFTVNKIVKPTFIKIFKSLKGVKFAEDAAILLFH